jgi:hypothetical protein
LAPLRNGADFARQRRRDVQYRVPVKSDGLRTLNDNELRIIWTCVAAGGALAIMVALVAAHGGRLIVMAAIGAILLGVGLKQLIGIHRKIMAHVKKD